MLKKLQMPALMLVAATLLVAFTALSNEPDPEPPTVQTAGDYAFNSAGELIRPEGYRQWVYVGTPLTPNDPVSEESKLRTGLANAAANNTRISVRMINRISCSMRIRREFFRMAVRRYSMAAQATSSCRRRFQRWIKIGIAAARPQRSIHALAKGQIMSEENDE